MFSGIGRIWIGLALLTSANNTAIAQIRWDGGGSDSLWQNPRNWYPDGLPLVTDSILLDHSLTDRDFRILLPPGASTTIIRSLRISPDPGRSITLVLPSTNTASPGLQVTDTGDCIRLGRGAELRNSSGATSGDPIQLAGRLHISDGASYVHNTVRGNARIIDQLSVATGTENGAFIFDVPGNAGYTVSLTGNTFGTLILTASAAGGNKSYSGSGTTDLRIRGSLRIFQGASLTSTLTSNIKLSGDLQVDGSLHLTPATSGTTARSLILCGQKEQSISGAGPISLGSAFRNMECSLRSRLLLARNLHLPLTSQSFVVQDSATLSLGTFAISGEAAFRCAAGSTLELASPDGIQTSTTAGNIRTRIRELSPEARYRFVGSGAQTTGNGLPDSIRTLDIDKPFGSLSLARSLRVTFLLSLSKGRIITSPDNLLTLDRASVSSLMSPFGITTAGWDSCYVDGPLRMRIPANSSVVLPIGNDTVHAPIRIESRQSEPVMVLASFRNKRFTDSIPATSSGLSQIIGPGHWEIRPDSPSQSFSAMLSLSWRYAGDSLASISWKDSLKVAYANTSSGGAVWERAGISHRLEGGPDRGWIRPLQAISRFGQFALAQGSPDASLPLTSIHLNVQPEHRSVRINWKVEGSDEKVLFRVERSQDGRQFECIQQITASSIRSGTSFSCIDGRPQPGRNLYRVSVQSERTRTLLSPVRQIFLRDRALLRLFPNPTAGMLYIRGIGKDELVEGGIFDATGRRWLFVQWPQAAASGINVSSLPPGWYLLQICRDGTWETHWFMRTRNSNR